MEGMVQAAEKIFHLPVRLGTPKRIGGLVDIVKSPRFSTTVGLLLYEMAKTTANEKKRSFSGTNIFNKVLNRMNEWVKEFF